MNKSVKSFNEGRAKIAIWKNKSKAGNTFHTASLASLYKDKEDNWKDGTSFSLRDLRNLQGILKDAVTYLEKFE